MPLSKSIDFLNENAGDVIKYRLHTEILQDVNKTEQDSLFEKVLQTPNYKLVESYVNLMDILAEECIVGTIGPARFFTKLLCRTERLLQDS